MHEGKNSLRGFMMKKIKMTWNLAKKALVPLALIGFVLASGLSSTACKNGSTGGGGVDTTALTAKIIEANTEMLRTETADHADEVPVGKNWVTVSVMNTFEAAISAAEAVRDAAESQEAVNAAFYTLDSAIDVFIAARSPGTNALDTLALASLITEANDLKLVIVVSDSAASVPLGAYWVTQTVMNAFESAIAAAQNALASATTQTAIDSARAALQTAMSTFNSAFQPGAQTSNFTSAQVSDLINRANTLKDATEISTNGNTVSPLLYWVSQSVADALNGKITALQGASGQSAIDAAFLALVDAVGDFNESRQHGTIPDKSELRDSIDWLNEHKVNVVLAANAAAAPWGSNWATPAEFAALNTTINDATAVLNNNNATVNQVEAAEAALETAYMDFIGAVTKNGPGTQPIQVSFNALTQDGNNTTRSTSELTLTFDKAINDFDNDDITLSGVEGVTKGEIVAGGGPAYVLRIGGEFANNSNLTVALAKEGYAFTPASRNVTIYQHAPPPDIGGSVSIDGTPHVGYTLTANTSALTADGDIAYRWTYADNESFTLGSNSTLVVQANAVGRTIRLIVTSTGNSGSRTSDTAAVVSYGPIIDFTFTPRPNLIIGHAMGYDYTTSNNQIATFGAPVGGRSPHTYSLVAGEGAADNALFTITGTFLNVGNADLTEARTYSIRVQVQDNESRTFAKQVTFTVNYPPAPAPAAAIGNEHNLIILANTANSDGQNASPANWINHINLTSATVNQDRLKEGDDISGWFDPRFTGGGLSYTVENASGNHIGLIVAGQPTSVYSGPVTITIPADVLLDTHNNPSFTSGVKVSGDISYRITQGADTVCRIDDRHYLSIQAAIGYTAGAMADIIVTRSHEISEVITIPSGGIITIRAETDGITISRAENHTGNLFNLSTGNLTLGNGLGSAHTPRLIIDYKAASDSGFIINMTGSARVQMYSGVELRNAGHAAVNVNGATAVFGMAGGVIAGNYLGLRVWNSSEVSMTGGIIYGADAGENANERSINVQSGNPNVVILGETLAPDNYTVTYGTAP